MKKTVLITVLLLGLVNICNAEEQHLSTWKMRMEGSSKSFPAEIPATVAGVLADNGVLDGRILESDTYFKQDKSDFDKAWTFTTRFRTPARKGGRWTLQFNGLNFYADIKLNGKTLATSDTCYGVFIKREYDITSMARSLRRNRLTVTLKRAQSGDLNIGFVDWNPRPLDESMGIVRDVVLRNSGDVVVSDAFVRPVLNPGNLSEADLDMRIALDNLSSEAVSGTLRISFENGTAEIPVEVPAGGTVLKLTPGQMPILHVDNPRIWWTWDLGTPELYDMTVEFAADGKVSDVRNIVFGIRSITSTVKDNHRQFFLNGRPVLVKGAGWTDEIFLRDTHDSNLIQAEYVKDMGMNCIRFENIWGKDDNIYDCCDRLGLMAMVGWSCQWEWEDYCGLPETDNYGCINDERSMNLAVRYFHDQLIRLHNHPSIICWLTGSDRIPNPELERLDMELYGELEYRPYVCSAKDITSLYGGPSGTKMAGPYEYVGPDYWYLDTENGGAFGFNTETGVGMNIPQLPSLKRMIPQESLWPLSEIWDRHCTASSSAMNTTGMMSKVMEGTFGKAESLEEYVNRAHALDYDATRSMFEAFRCNIPDATGIIQWMLNSAWPSLYWQLYDYYLVPTASYYGTRKACQPLQLVYNYKEQAVYALNETGIDRKITARISSFDANSLPLACNDIQMTAKDNCPVKVMDVPAHEGGIFLNTEIYDEDGRIVTDNFYCIPASNSRYDWRHSNWYCTPAGEYCDMSFVSELAQAELEMSSKWEDGTCTVTLHNTSGTVSFQNILQLFGADGNLIVPAFWSDNFVSVLPGQTKTIICTVPGGGQGDIEIRTWNTTIK